MPGKNEFPTFGGASASLSQEEMAMREETLRIKKILQKEEGRKAVENLEKAIN